MRKYWYIAKMTAQEHLSYRANFAFEVIGSIVATLAVMLVWLVIFENRAFIGEYTRSEMITYFIVIGWIFSFIFMAGQGDEINDDIHNGEFTFWLVRPIGPLMYYFVRDLVRKALTGTIGFLGVAVIYFVYRESFILPQFGTLVMFFVLVLAAVVLHFFIFSLGSIIAFWMEQTWGVRFVMRVVAELAMGVLMPLSLLPGVWKGIAYILPFQLMGYFPTQLYLGRKLPFSPLYAFILLAFWLIVSFFLTRFVYKRGVRVYTAPGI